MADKITSTHLSSLEGARAAALAAWGDLNMPAPGRDAQLTAEDLDTTTDDQRLAMQLVLQYLKIKSGMGYGKIASYARIPAGKRKDGTTDAGRHVNNFHTQGTCPYVMRLKRYLETQIVTHEAFRHAPKYINNIVNVMKGTNGTIKPENPNLLVDDVFSHVIEEGNEWKERVFQIYKGAWFIIRYAAGVAPGGLRSKWTLMNRRHCIP